MPDLYDFQEIGVRFLRSVKRGILADDRGVGKTPQAIVAASSFKQILVVVPSYDVAIQWKNRIAEWDGGSTWVTMEKTPANWEAKWIITNYETVSVKEEKDEKTGKKIKTISTLLGRTLLPRKWLNVVFDEAHKLKNHKSQRSIGAEYLSKRAENVFLLTGSPLLNRVAELWALLRLCDPIKYKSRWKFLMKHAAAGPGEFGWVYNDHATDPEALRNEIAPYFLRRENKDTGRDRPKVTTDRVFFEPTEKQLSMLSDLESKCYAEYSGGVLKYENSLSYYTAMKKVCSTPWEFGIGAGPKMDWLRDLVEGTDRKILVFCENITTTYKIQETLDTSVSVYNGKLNQEERTASLEEFVNSSQVLALTIDIGHLGLDMLKCASIVVMYDEDWTPEINSQCVGRVDREGQTQPVNVYTLHVNHVIDTAVRGANETKEQLIKDIMEAKSVSNS